MRRRQKLLRPPCHPAARDAYSLDNISIFNRSVNRKSKRRQSKRSYGNAAFENPDLEKHPLTLDALVTFVSADPEIHKEFMELPIVKSNNEDVPKGCEDKNR